MQLSTGSIQVYYFNILLYYNTAKHKENMHYEITLQKTDITFEKYIHVLVIILDYCLYFTASRGLFKTNIIQSVSLTHLVLLPFALLTLHHWTALFPAVQQALEDLRSLSLSLQKRENNVTRVDGIICVRSIRQTFHNDTLYLPFS